jgi:DNA-binding response OmpR family regulator
MVARILLAEDEPALRRSLRFILQQEGWETIEAADGEEALERARRDPPDLLLAELLLPPSGALPLLRTLRAEEEFRGLPVILLTGTADSRERAAGLESGADDTVAAPFDPIEVVARVRAQLRIRQMQEELLVAERLRVTLETAGAACHELSQPLTVMCGSAELLLQKMPEADPLRRLALRIFESGKRATDLLHRLQGIHSYRTRPYLDRSILDLERSSGHGGGAEEGGADEAGTEDGGEPGGGE